MYVLLIICMYVRTYLRTGDVKLCKMYYYCTVLFVLSDEPQASNQGSRLSIASPIVTAVVVCAAVDALSGHLELLLAGLRGCAGFASGHLRGRPLPRGGAFSACAGLLQNLLRAELFANDWSLHGRVCLGLLSAVVHACCWPLHRGQALPSWAACLRGPRGLRGNVLLLGNWRKG